MNQQFVLFEINQHISSDLSPTEEQFNLFLKFIEDYTRVFKIDKLAKFNLETITENIFNLGISTEIDEIEEGINEAYSNLMNICKQFTKSIGNDIDTWFKVENNERDGYFITATPARANALQKKLKNYGSGVYTISTAVKPFTLNAGEITFKKQAANKTAVSCPQILVKLCQKYQRGIFQIGKKCQSLFKEYTAQFERDYSGVMNIIADL